MNCRYLAGLCAIGMVLLTSCVFRQPERTERPVVPIEPWIEKAVTSSASGQHYTYLFLSGPSPEAPNMLLLPGGFFDTRIWLYFRDLARHFNLYALDWPNDTPFYKGRVEDMGLIAADFLTAVAVSELHVTGISAGAYPAVELATNQPQLKVASVTLLSAVMFGVTPKEIRSRKRNTKIALCLKPDTMRATAEWLALRKDYKPAPGKVQQKDIFWVRPYTYYQQIFTMTRDQGDRRQKTDQIHVPVLIFHGTEDEILDYETSKHNPTAFPQAEFITIEGGTHSMTFHQGPELVKMLVDHHRRKGLLPKRQVH